MSSQPYDREKAMTDARSAYYEATAVVSSLVRQLGFAAIAVVWLFSAKNATGTVSVPNDLTWVAIVTVASLAFDFLHYVYRSLAWGMYGQRIEDEKNKIPKKGLYTDSINRANIGFIVVKVLCLAAAYVLLFIALASRLDPSGSAGASSPCSRAPQGVSSIHGREATRGRLSGRHSRAGTPPRGTLPPCAPT